MVTQDDIDAFSDDMDTVQEFVRRYAKGLPEDRLTTGVNGTKRLARACHGLLSMIAIQAEANASMLAHIHKTGEDAMEASSDPCRG